MGRHRPRLILLLPAALLLAACTSTPGTPASGPTTTTTRATPSAAGYPLPKGRQVQVPQGQTGSVALKVGDTLATHRPTMGTRPSGNSLVLAEVTDTQLIYQATSPGQATLATDDPPPPPTCPTTPCPPGRAAPPVVTVDITG
jgi:hypothetical protein